VHVCVYMCVCVHVYVCVYAHHDIFQMLQQIESDVMPIALVVFVLTWMV